ncbi:hypothetical protein [Legionella sainthelensi]|uniref:hypothetical protein n=1 Tax=Legionella sainthelensi TaxID=28087 RepID=UPI0013EEC9E8|nr:hypothetical protein [Legionella sainthelensi]
MSTKKNIIQVLKPYWPGYAIYRQEYFQSLIGFPFPSSTQWQFMEELAGCALLIFPALE